MRDVITNNPYIVKDKIIFSFYHCGSLGLRNRKLEEQLDDWRILNKYIQELK